MCEAIGHLRVLALLAIEPSFIGLLMMYLSSVATSRRGKLRGNNPKQKDRHKEL